MINGIGKKIVIGGIVIAITIVGGGFTYTYYMNKKSGKQEAKKNQKEIAAMVEAIENKEDVAITTLKPADYYSESKIYDIMHRMSNTKIIAEDNKIWGELPMKKEDIDNLRVVISEIDYEDREYLLEVLDKWEAGDYTRSDEEHNYFWGKLGGTIGRAIGVKEN